MKWTARIYPLFLRLFPADFRDEFGEEMTAVFIEAVREAGELGWVMVTAVCLREIRDWPGSVLQERLQAWRGKMTSNGFGEDKPLPRSELLAALIVFLLPLFRILPFTSVNLPQWMDYFLVILYLTAVLFALRLAIIKRLPGWSLPYMGLVLMPIMIISLSPSLSGWLYPHFLQSFGPRASWSISVRIIYSGAHGFIMWLLILLAALLLVNLLRLLPSTRAVWQRIRADWTQLSFMLYGGIVFYIILTFDEYRHGELWKFAAFVWLALGAWLYLRAKNRKRRILALIGGATGAVWSVVLAKWTLIPLQKWPAGYPISPSEVTRWVETGSAMIAWVWILLMLTAPALLNWLPSAPPAAVQKDLAAI